MNDLKESIVLTYNEVGPCVSKVEVTIPAESIKDQAKQTLKEFSRYAAVPGFRRGKAPASLIKNRFSEQVQSEVMKAVMSSSYQKIMEEKKIDIISFLPPSEQVDKIDEKKDFNVTFEFNVAPDFEIPEYKGIKLDAPSSEITDEQINQQLDYYRNMFADYKTVDTEAEAGDMLKVSYTSDFELEGEAAASLKRQVSCEENWLWLNEPELIPGCVEALTGSKTGDEIELAATYAEDYREHELAGKTVNYKVKVLEVQRRGAENDDNELVKKMRLENFEQLKDRVKEDIKRQNDAKRQSELRKQLNDKLSEAVGDFPLPPQLVESETLKQLRNIASQMVRTKEDADKFQAEKENHQKEAEKSAKEHLKQFFLFRKIAEKEDINVESEEIDQQIKGISQMYGYKEKDLKLRMSQNGGIEDLHMDMLISKVATFLLDQAEIEEK